MSPKQIKQARSQLKLTQPALAAELGVHPISVSRWERGKVAIPEPTARLLKMLVAQSKQKDGK